MTQRFELANRLTCWVDEQEVTFITPGNAELKFERTGHDSYWKMSSKDSWYVVEEDIDRLIQALQIMKGAMK